MVDHLLERLQNLQARMKEDFKEDSSNQALFFKELLEITGQCIYKLSENPTSTWIKKRLFEIPKVMMENDGKALVVVHIIPQNAFNTPFNSIDLEYVNQHFLPLLDGGFGNFRRINSQGILFKESDSNSYAQLFRDGRVEWVSTNLSNSKYLYPYRIEQGIHTAITEYIHLVANFQPDISFNVYIHLINVEGYYFSIPRTQNKNHIIDTPNIELPTITITPTDRSNFNHSLNASIDVMWNAAGYVKAIPQNALY
jgi:hypothetical protein